MGLNPVDAYTNKLGARTAYMNHNGGNHAAYDNPLDPYDRLPDVASWDFSVQISTPTNPGGGLNISATLKNITSLAQITSVTFAGNPVAGYTFDPATNKLQLPLINPFTLPETVEVTLNDGTNPAVTVSETVTV